MSERVVRIAAAQYPIGFFNRWPEYEAHITGWVAEAALGRAKLLLFPEYFSLEISSIFGPGVYESLDKTLEKLSHALGGFLALYRSLAQKYQVHICAGSFPVKDGDTYYNRCYFFWPNGHCEWQEKLQMTRFEKEKWNVSSGSGVKEFLTDFGTVAVNICYDSEFPLFARQQAEQGAEIILVPSCTDTLAGFNRVKIGCQARALENQCYVVQSPTIGECSWQQAVDTNIGVAAFYSPVDHGFPPNGILHSGKPNEAQWVYYDLDLEAIQRVRKEGQVFNFKDWNGQLRHVGLVQRQK